eukprot:190948_1
MSLCAILFYLNSVSIILAKRILPTGITADDWNISNWKNGAITIESTTFSNKTYHGLFDGLMDENNLSRNDIQLERTGTLTMTFTLIFGCQIIEKSDNITVTVGTTSNIYYWEDKLGEYPYKTSQGFTINKNNDSILYTSCSSGSFNTTAWSIKSSITSKKYTPNKRIYIAFISNFNYNIPYDDDDKYWAVTDIEFNVKKVNSLQDEPLMHPDNVAVTVVLISVNVIALGILFAIPRKYYDQCNRKRERKAHMRSIEMGTYVASLARMNQH